MNNDAIRLWVRNQSAMLDHMSPIDIVTAWEEYRARVFQAVPSQLLAMAAVAVEIEHRTH